MIGLALLLLATFPTISRPETFLFAVTEGDGNRQVPGLYGASIGDPPSFQQLAPTYDFHYGYYCLNADSGVSGARGEGVGLDLRGVAYDPSSGHVLLSMETDDRDVYSLFEGNVCRHGGCEAGQHEGCSRGICEWKARHRNRLRILFEQYRFGPSVLTPKSFAFHDGTVYFVAQKRVSAGREHHRNVIELRRFGGCGDPFPLRSHSQFDMDECSELLSRVVDEEGVYSSFEPMTGLRVFSKDGDIIALFTLQQLTFEDASSGNLSEVSVNLYAVRVSSGEKVLLYREVVPKHYRKYIMEQLGAVDHKRDKVCWSAVDRVLCGDFTSRDGLAVRHVRYAVSPGQASGIVCEGESLYSNVTTGVAIADVTHEVISLFFGCMAGVPGMGGAGFLHMHSYEFHVTPQLQSLSNVSSPLYAGQLFLSEACESDKPASSQAPHTIDHGGQPKPGSSTQAGISHRASGLTVTTALTLALVMIVVPHL